MKRKTPDGIAKTVVLGLCLLLGLGAAAWAGPGGQGHVPPPHQGVVTVAAAQTNPILFDNAANLADILSKTSAAAAAGAELVVFPEMALTGYKFKTISEALPYAEPVPGPAVGAVAAVAGTHDIYVVFGLLERDGMDLFDTVALVGPEGYLGKYRKAHMGYRSESKFFSRGETGFRVFRTSIGRIAMGICYDQTLPEGARVAGVDGADILALSYADGGARWGDYMMSRAAENHVYAIGANRIGEERFGSFVGGSLIAGPNWDTLAQADGVSDTIIYADIDLSALDKRWLADRRPELYGPLAESLEPQILGIDFNPESQVLGTGEEVILRVATASIRRNTRVVAELLSGDAPVVRAWGRIGSQGATLSMATPDDLPVGTYTMRVTVGRHSSLSMEQPYVVKDVSRPAVLGVVPTETGAATKSSIYMGFDVDVQPASGVPVIVSDGATTYTFSGSVNTGAEIDNRLRASYSGLQRDTTYTATLPADRVFSVASGFGNDEMSFSFTTASAAFTIDAAVVQMSPSFKDKDANLASMLASLDTVAAQGVELAVFPELALTGTGFTSPQDAIPYAEQVSGPSVAAMAARAQALGLYAAFGMLETAGHGCPDFGVDFRGRPIGGHGQCWGGAKLFSTYVLVGPEGVVGTYRKTHLSAEDAKYLVAGGGPLSPFETSIGKVGLMLGDDVLFPEVARVLFLQGAAVVALGANLQGSLWTEQARTRGGESKVWIVAANSVGPGEGQSIITGSTRTVSAQAGPYVAEIIYSTLDIDKMRDKVGRGSVDQNTGKVRATHYEFDRRPDLYDRLVSQGCRH